MSLRDLSQQFSTEGRIEVILLRAARRGTVESVLEVTAEPGRGLLGDHRATVQRTRDELRKREVTLYQLENLATVANWCGIESLDPARLRRNLVVSGINLVSMRSPFPDTTLAWSIGDTVRIEVTGPCDPCSRMEQELGPGGYNALRGHGGVTARLLTGGVIRVGDFVRLRSVSQQHDGSPT